MANAIKWQATLGTFTTLIAGLTATPTLKNLVDTASVIGNAISGNRDRYCGLQLKCKFGSTPAAGGVVEVYFIPAIDGTNYADGSSSVAPAAHLRVCTFAVLATTNQQLLADSEVRLPPFDFKPLVLNRAGAAMTNVDSENILSYRPYNEEVQ